MKDKPNIQENVSGCISQDLLLKYLNGKLGGKEMNRVERHLAVCPMCADELEGLQHLQNPSDMQDIQDELNNKIDQRLRNEVKIVWFTNIGRIAATLLIIIGISGLVYYVSNQNKPSLILSEDAYEEKSKLDVDKIMETPMEKVDNSKEISIGKPPSDRGTTSGNRKRAEAREQEAQDVTTIIDDDVEIENKLMIASDEEIIPVTQQIQSPSQGQDSPVVTVAEVDSQVEKKTMVVSGMGSNQSKGMKLTVSNAETQSAPPAPAAVSNIDEMVSDIEVEEEDAVFTIAEQMPEFRDENGDDFSTYIMKNRRYPTAAIENVIQGKVFVEFCVEPDGSVSNAKVIHQIDPLLDNEAIRIIESSPKWKPGTQRGKPVRVKLIFPISFELH